MFTNLIFNLMNGPIETICGILFEVRLNQVTGSLAFKLAFISQPDLRLE